MLLMCPRRLIPIMCLLFPLSVCAQVRNSAYQAYIDRYSDIAVEQMHQYKVPASITLAQGLLESDAGRSMLAVEGNNHFGIKCHSDWQGRTMHYDDDRRQECFRQYGSAAASFKDHSVFLTTGSRYASLFELNITDYKGWARGLKKAGYATNPQYADKLISIIELYNLDQYDSPDRRTSAGVQEISFLHQPYLSNGLLYIKLGEGETLKDISKEFSVSRHRLRRFNEINRKYIPLTGSVIYLEKKKCKSAKEYVSHTVESGESLWSISQLYGVRMKCLVRKNRLGEGNPLTVGMELKLR